MENWVNRTSFHRCYKILWILILIKVLLLGQISCFDFQKFDELFKNEECIQGQIVADFLNPAGINVRVPAEAESTGETLDLLYTNRNTHLLSEIQKEVENNKNSVDLLHELAQFNKISIQYTLIGEEGLPHDKTFQVRLDLGDETYFSKDKSLKKTKNALASLALWNTKYEKPPAKVQTSEKEILQLTPTVQLNNIAVKLGMMVEYVNENIDALHKQDLINDNSPSKNYYSLDSSSRSYLNKLNDSIYQENKVKTVKVGADEKTDQGPFAVRVFVGNKDFLGHGVSIQMARHDAASKALEHFKNMSLKQAEDCMAEGNECNKFVVKSPVSLLYETAQKRSQVLSFEVINESGTSNKKIFTTSCKYGDLETQGEGSSKKKSKKNAAEKMLTLLEKIEPISAGSKFTVQQSENKKKKKKKNKNKISKGMLANAKANIADTVANILSLATGNDDKRVIHDDGKGNKKPSKNKKDLLELTSVISINVQFSSFNFNNLYATIISLDTDPSYLCYSSDVTKDASEENASLAAINFIKRVGLDNIILPLKNKDSIKPKVVLKSKLPNVDGKSL